MSVSTTCTCKALTWLLRVASNFTMSSQVHENTCCVDEVYFPALVCAYRTVPKRVTSLQFTENEEYILTADRTGEVTRFPLDHQ